MTEEGRLSFEAFIQNMPPSVMSKFHKRKLQMFFELADVNRSGTTSMIEFLQWSLTVCALTTGVAVQEVFRRHNRSADGELNATEFKRAARDLGLGELPQLLFEQLLLTSDKTIEIERIIEAARKSVGYAMELHSILNALAYEKGGAGKSGLNTSGWQFTGTDAASARQALNELVTNRGAKLDDVYALMDQSGDNEISKGEFFRAMHRQFGFRGSDEVLNQMYDEMDEMDGSPGRIGYNEFSTWFMGRVLSRRQRMDNIRELSLAARVRQSTEEWDVDTLRQEIRAALDDAGALSQDLLNSWDDSKDNCLGKREWLIAFKRLCGISDSEWYDKVRDAVLDAFAVIDRDKAGTIDLREIDRWLNPGRRSEVRAQVKKARRMGAHGSDHDAAKPLWRPNGCRPGTRVRWSGFDPTKGTQTSRRCTSLILSNLSQAKHSTRVPICTAWPLEYGLPKERARLAQMVISAPTTPRSPRESLPAGGRAPSHRAAPSLEYEKISVAHRPTSEPPLVRGAPRRVRSCAHTCVCIVRSASLHVIGATHTHDTCIA